MIPNRFLGVVGMHDDFPVERMEVEMKKMSNM